MQYSNLIVSIFFLIMVTPAFHGAVLETEKTVTVTRKLVATTIGACVNAQKNSSALTDQELISEAVKLLHSQDLPSMSGVEIGGLSFIRRHHPRCCAEHFGGVLRAFPEFVRDGYKKNPNVVRAASLIGAGFGGGLGWLAAPKLVAYYGLEAVGLSWGIPPGWTTPIVTTVTTVGGGLFGGFTGASVASWAVLDEQEFEKAYIRGYNAGVKSTRILVNDFESLRDFKKSFRRANRSYLFDNYNGTLRVISDHKDALEKIVRPGWF